MIVNCWFLYKLNEILFKVLFFKLYDIDKCCIDNNLFVCLFKFNVCILGINSLLKLKLLIDVIVFCFLKLYFKFLRVEIYSGFWILYLDKKLVFKSWFGFLL